MAQEMAGLGAAKKELRTLMRQKLSQISSKSIKQQCPWALGVLQSVSN